MGVGRQKRVGETSEKKTEILNKKQQREIILSLLLSLMISTEICVDFEKFQTEFNTLTNNNHKQS